jgi:hypothetical protein
MADRAWVSAHVFYSDPLDPLLRKAIRPLVTELAGSGLVDGWFFLRYWEGGPHVRLRLRPTGDPGPVREAVKVHCGLYLSEHPATTPVAPDGYATAAAAMARYEHRDEPPEPLRETNSVAFIDYRPEHDRYGSGPALAAVERHFVESSTIALALVPADRQARRTAAFCAILLAHRLCPPVAAAPAWAGRYDAHRLPRIGAAMRDLADGATRPGSLTAWRDSIVGLRDAVRGTVTGADRAAEVVDTCVHLFCNRLGVTLPEEAYLRSLAARTAAELSGRE